MGLSYVVIQHSIRTQFAFPLPFFFLLLLFPGHKIIRMFIDNNQKSKIRKAKMLEKLELERKKRTKWLTIKCMHKSMYIFRNGIRCLCSAFFFLFALQLFNVINICWFRHSYPNGFGTSNKKQNYDKILLIKNSSSDTGIGNSSSCNRRYIIFKDFFFLVSSNFIPEIKWKWTWLRERLKMYSCFVIASPEPSTDISFTEFHSLQKKNTFNRDTNEW